MRRTSTLIKPMSFVGQVRPPTALWPAQRSSAPSTRDRPAIYLCFFAGAAHEQGPHPARAAAGRAGVSQRRPQHAGVHARRRQHVRRRRQQQHGRPRRPQHAGVHLDWRGRSRYWRGRPDRVLRRAVVANADAAAHGPDRTSTPCTSTSLATQWVNAPSARVPSSPDLSVFRGSRTWRGCGQPRKSREFPRAPTFPCLTVFRPSPDPCPVPTMALNSVRSAPRR